MVKNMKKDNRWWRPLVAIPIVLAVDIVVIMAAVMIDVFMIRETDMIGHGFPGITTLVIWIMAFITAVVVVRSVVQVVMRLFKHSDKNDGVDKVAVNTGDNKLPKAVKPVYSYFIPWSIQVLVSTLVVYLIGKYEIESFYSDPHHIGFAIPIVAFMAAFALFVLAVITFFISLYVYRRAKRKAEKMVNGD